MVNHEKYEERLAFVSSLLAKEFNITPKSIEPVAYEARCPFHFNNFIYRAELPDATTSSIPARDEPGTYPIPAGTTALIVRLTNAAAGLNEANRVENEVACMSLARRALDSAVVPRVYGWSRASGKNTYGWIIMETMPGVMIDETFKDMKAKDKRFVLQQIAEMLAALQRFELPEAIKSFGGLTFDENGEIVSGEMTLFPGGPYASYEDLCRAMLEFQLKEAEKSSVLKGWEANGVGERLRRFIQDGVGPIVDNVGVQKKSLVHGDFTLNNLLFDPSTNRVTALLDLDWAHVSYPADEFSRSFVDFGGKLPGREDPLRDAFLNGFPTPLPASSDDAPWEDAKIWDEEMERAGCTRPSTIKGMEELSGLHWLSEKIAPFMLTEELAVERVRRRDPASLEVQREEAEAVIVKYLEESGL